MRTTRLIAAVCVIAGLVNALPGCDRGENSTADQQGNAAEPKASRDSLPSDIFLASVPTGAQDVTAIKKAGVKQGDEVVVRGRIGGRVEPFVEGRAVFQIVDLGVRTCEGDEGCKTPWDSCCDPDAAKHSATIQLVGADEKPLKASLKGVGGLKPLAQVVAKGTVASAGGGESLVVNATGIHIRQ